LTRGLKSTQLKNFASTRWLELSYGWTPFFFEIYGAATYVQQLLSETDADLSINAFGFSEAQGQQGNQYYNVQAQGSCLCNWSVDLQIVNENVRHQNALGLHNPGLIFWELVPLSFVADWFIPIGTWLESLTALNGFGIVQKSLSWHTDILAYGEAYGSFKGTPSATHQVTKFERVTNQTPQIQNPLGDLGARLGKRRYASAMALLYQAFRS
jgi:hypothetical protein